MKAKTALITGGCGQIGSAIARVLAHRGCTPIIIDDLSVGSTRNIEDIEGAVLYKADILEDSLLLKGLIQETDIVYHMAAELGVRNILNDTLGTIHRNLDGTRKVLNAATKAGRPCVIASTSEIYSLSDRLPFREDDPVTLGASKFSRWSYATVKLIGEFEALASGIPVVVPRYFNATSEVQSAHYGMAMTALVGQAVRGEPMTVFGDGSQTRCFQYAPDAALATVKLVEAGAFGQVVNIGGSEEISILSLAKLIRKRTGSSSEIVLVSYEKAFPCGNYQDMRRRVPSLERLQALTGYVPSTPLVDIIDAITVSMREEVVAAT